MGSVKTKRKAWLDRMIRVRKDALPKGAMERIRETLTLEKKKFGGEPEIIPIYRKSGAFIWLPRFYGVRVLRRYGFEIEDSRSDGFQFNMAFRGQLGSPPFPSGQPKFVEDILAGIRENGLGGFGVADCGMGKTVMGSAIAAALGRSTLVLVHRSPLVSQWRESFRRHIRVNGKAPAVGLVQGDRCDFGPERPLSVAMVQSLSAREYPKDFYRAWGLVLIDETHHIPARTWQEAVTNFSSRYVVGLTATLRRKDGLQPVFTHALGNVLAHLHRDNVQADAQFYGVHFLGGVKSMQTFGSMNRTLVEKRLAVMPGRNEIIVAEIEKAVQAGRQRIMVFSGVRSHLAELYELLPVELKRKTGFYVGQRKQEQLDRVTKKTVILATYGMADEGLDIGDIDAVFLATPRPDVEQPVGRALRFYVQKMPPIIVDFVDKIKQLVGWAHRRRAQYIRMGIRLRNDVPEARR